MSGSVILSGSIAQRPGYGGHTWALLQWLLGFRALGWDVFFLDRLEEGMCGDARDLSAMLASPQVSHFVETMRRFGLTDDASLEVRGAEGARTIGVSRESVLDRVASADFLLDVMGFLGDEEMLGRARRRVFLDIDPGFGQMWRALGLHDPFGGHDDHVTIGLNIGLPACSIPDCGVEWITTVPPIVLDDWPVSPVPANGAFRTIGSWRGPWAPVEYEGEVFGLRVHEFRRFFDLPSRTGLRFEAALDIDGGEAADIERLDAGGWHRVDPARVAPDADSYASFLRESMAEFMVAKNMYVRSRSGWFSDRSIAFLASGRPVLAQNTGLSERLPAGRGLLFFDTLEEAVTGATSIAADPRRHGRAARDLAAAHFDARHVLATLAERIAGERVGANPEADACA